jgi:ribosomal-protein-alanine N-acetyltransferase
VVTPELRTERLRLRAWRDDDLVPFAAMNADPEVMAWFPAPLTREESDAFVVERIVPSFAARGFGLWAVERTDLGEFIGFTGLVEQTFDAPFSPAVEVGWRLARSAWGQGFATEAAEAGLAFGFEQVGLTEVVSMTVPGNVRSRAVMERLGMTHDPVDDFDHPRVPAGSPLVRHVLYRLPRERWVSQADRPPAGGRSA